MSPLRPVSTLRIGGMPARTIASLGGRNGITLIVMTAEDAYHVVFQTADGGLCHRLGPVTMDAAIAAAERVGSGAERSVTADGLAAVAGLTAKLAIASAERDALLARLERELTPDATP